MRRIEQKGDHDCGVACLAMLAGIEIEEAREFLLRKRFKATSVKAIGILAGLRHYGRKPLRDKSIRLKDIDLNDLRYDALLSCWYIENGQKEGHWAVWDAKKRRVLDPWGTGDNKLQIRTYIPIAN